MIKDSKHTEETKEKMREARKKNPMRYWLGKKRPEHSKRMSGENSPNFGGLSKEHKLNISKSMKGKSSWNKKGNKRPEMLGDLNPNWQGGIQCEPYCDVWLDKEYKQSIKDRDGNRCLNPDCRCNSNRLTLHHIDYNKKNCHPFNLITLCNSCNVRANKDRRWHRFWYKAIIYQRYIGNLL